MEGDTEQSSVNQKDGSAAKITNQNSGNGAGENPANEKPVEESPSLTNERTEEKEKLPDINLEKNIQDGNDSDKGIEMKISSKGTDSETAEDEKKAETKAKSSLNENNAIKGSNTDDDKKDEVNFNENRCSAEDGLPSGRHHNGTITEKGTKKKSKSPTKALPKKVSITEVALFNMPDFPDSDTRLPQKAEEQLRVMTHSKDNKRLKQWLRTHNWPVGHPIRTNLWQHMCKYMFKSSGNIYQEMVDDLFKDEFPDVLPLPAFVDPEHVPEYYLTQTGVYSVHMILIILEQLNPDVTFCPSLFPLAAVFLHFMEPADCFNCLYGMLRTTESRFMAQTNTAVDATHLVMRDLAKHHAKSAFSSVFKDTDGNVEPVFRNWIWWIFNDLPFPILVQVLDCYLFEGVKILYRVALAILILYHKHCVKLHGPHSPLLGANVTARLKHFCEEMPYSVEKIFKTAFGIRGLGRKELRKLQLRHEMYEKSQTIKMTRASSFARPASRASFSGPPTTYARSYSIPAPISAHKQAKTKGDMMSRDLTDFEPESSSSEAVVPKPRARSLTCLNIDEVHCYTLKHRDLLTLWAWIPSRYTISQPHLIYTTEEHGISLRTLYSRIAHHEPTLFVVKTTKNEIFGAYCSTDWRERVQKGQNKNLSYFGTGETFVFSLFPKKKVYHWVGLNQSDVPATAHMFLAGDHRALDIGGGNGTAIHLDEGLVHCRTDRCDTFDNEPLCSSKDFSCKVLEVFGFR